MEHLDHILLCLSLSLSLSLTHTHTHTHILHLFLSVMASNTESANHHHSNVLLPVSLTQTINHMTASDSEATGDFKVPALTDKRFILVWFMII